MDSRLRGNDGMMDSGFRRNDEKGGNDKKGGGNDGRRDGMQGMARVCGRRV
ncbi:MAG: hypothetical protein ACR2P4_10490 [Gammaproteobacteria bacterium]